jgi:hypothetical protein
VSQAQIEHKLRTYATDVLPDGHVAQVIDAVERLEDFGPVGRLMDLLRSAPRAILAAE